MEVTIIELQEGYQIKIIDWDRDGLVLGSIKENDITRALKLGYVLRVHYDAVLTSDIPAIHKLAFAGRVTVNRAYP